MRIDVTETSCKKLSCIGFQSTVERYERRKIYFERKSETRQKERDREQTSSKPSDSVIRPQEPPQAFL